MEAKRIFNLKWRRQQATITYHHPKRDENVSRIFRTVQWIMERASAATKQICSPDWFSIVGTRAKWKKSAGQRRKKGKTRRQIKFVELGRISRDNNNFSVACFRSIRAKKEDIIVFFWVGFSFMRRFCYSTPFLTLNMRAKNALSSIQYCSRVTLARNVVKKTQIYSVAELKFKRSDAIHSANNNSLLDQIWLFNQTLFKR